MQTSPLKRQYIDFDPDRYLEGLPGRKPYTYPKGSKYDGQMDEKDKRHGLGRLTWKQGSVYDGHWEKNERSGQGVMRWSDNSKYVGEWKKDKRNGYGVYYLMEGHIYEGEFKDHMMHG